MKIALLMYLLLQVLAAGHLYVSLNMTWYSALSLGAIGPFYHLATIILPMDVARPLFPTKIFFQYRGQPYWIPRDGND